MKAHAKISIRRRHLLGLAMAGVAVATGATVAADRVAPEPDDPKRKARFQPNSLEVQNFYRVNSYPRS